MAGGQKQPRRSPTEARTGLRAEVPGSARTACRRADAGLVPRPRSIHIIWEAAWPKRGPRGHPEGPSVALGMLSAWGPCSQVAMKVREATVSRGTSAGIPAWHDELHTHRFRIWGLCGSQEIHCFGSEERTKSDFPAGLGHDQEGRNSS